MENLAVILAAIALGWFWIDSLGAREEAIRICRAACERNRVQLLDQTVALRRLGFRRDGDGRLRWRRAYGFEFSEEGVGRHAGHLVLVDRRLESLSLGLPDYPEDS